jgi:hypothetical protein
MRKLFSPSPRAIAIVAVLLFGSTLALRTRHISEIFELLGDQVLYWNIALRPWRDLPLGGGPSSVGGTTIGPAFIWAMWGIRHLVGPWTGNLPHAGGIGISIIQSAADAWLAVAIWKRFQSLPLALAVILLTATAPEDMSLSASIWNPPMAEALVKMSIACALSFAGNGASLWWAAGATAAAVLAVQCHSSAVFFAAPAIVSLLGGEMLTGRRARALQAAGVAAMVALLCEAPYLLDRVIHSDKAARPAAVIANVSYTIAHPDTVRPVAAFHALVDACQTILVRPWEFSSVGVVLVACAAATAFRTRRDLALAGVTIAPPLAAIAGFALWQAGFESYWFMTMMPSVALTIGLAVTSWKPLAPIAAMALLVAVLAALPARFAYSLTINRLPSYGALARGSREMRRYTEEIRSIDVDFPVDRTTNTHFIYERVLGGRVTPTAPFAATIERTGHVRFTPAPAEAGRE